MQSSTANTGGGVEGHQNEPIGGKTMKYPKKEEKDVEETTMEEVRKAIKAELKRSLKEMVPSQLKQQRQQMLPQQQQEVQPTFNIEHLRGVFERLEQNQYTVEDLQAASNYAKQVAEFITDETNTEAIGDKYDSGTIQRNSKNLTALATELNKIADQHVEARTVALALVDEIGMLGYRYNGLQQPQQQPPMGTNPNVNHNI